MWRRPTTSPSGARSRRPISSTPPARSCQFTFASPFHLSLSLPFSSSPSPFFRNDSFEKPKQATGDNGELPDLIHTLYDSSRQLGTTLSELDLPSIHLRGSTTLYSCYQIGGNVRTHLFSLFSDPFFVSQFLNQFRSSFMSQKSI